MALSKKKRVGKKNHFRQTSQKDGKRQKAPQVRRYPASQGGDSQFGACGFLTTRTRRSRQAASAWRRALLRRSRGNADALSAGNTSGQCPAGASPVIQSACRPMRLATTPQAKEFAAHIVPQAVIRFREKFPDVELRLVEGLGHTTRPLLPDDPAIRFKPIAHLGQIVVARRGHGSHAAATELAPFDLRTASTTRRRVHLPAAILDARGRTGVGHAVSLDLSGS
jgi:hypothetical protein